MEVERKWFKCRKRLVVSFLLIFLFLANKSVFPQEQENYLITEWKDTILENQRFTLKIITPYAGKLLVSIMDPEWPDGIQKVSGPYPAQLTIQKEDGSFGTVLQVIYTLRSKSAGIFRIPPVTVTPRPTAALPGELPSPLSTHDVFIPVLQNDERHLRFPLILEWERLPETLYVGQSVPMVLIMKNLEEIDLPESVSFSSPGGAILENVEGLGDIGFSGLNDRTLFNVPMDTWMLTPSETGILSLPPASVRISGVERSTGRVKIPVKALPEEAEESGAVGNFSLSADLSDSRIIPGNSLSLRIKLEGTGNLNYLNMPEPVFSEELSVSIKENQDITADVNGFSGFLEKVYTIRPDLLGKYEIRIPSYSWLNPETGRIETRSESLYYFTVAGDLSAEDGESEFRFFLMDLDDSRKARGWSLYRVPLLYLFLLPGLLFFILILTFRRFKPSLLSVFLFTGLFLSASASSLDTPAWISEADSLFHGGKYRAALNSYVSNSAGWENNGSYLYNRGILSFLSGDHAEGIVDLRNAMILMPMNRQIHESLQKMEDMMNLDNQHRVNMFVHPDLLLLILVLGFNGGMIALAYCFLRKSSIPVILFMIFISLSLFAGIELGRMSLYLSRPLAVLKEEGLVKKIPEEIGSQWLTLPEGTSVSFKKEEGDYILVNTAYGLEGWVLKEQLLFVKENRTLEF